MAYKEIICNSLNDYCKITQEWCYNNHWVIYRGHPDSTFKLSPGIARNSIKSVDLLKSYERDLFYRFKTNLNNHLTKFHIDRCDELGFLSVGQHYGLETRLLDWTADPLIALYFAVSNTLPKAEICVWACCVEREDSREINHFDPKVSLNPFDIDCTYLFKPNSFSERIKAQAAWFSLHHCHSKKGFIPLEENSEYREDLAKILFKKNMIGKLRDELDVFHKNEARAFPDDISAEIRHLIWKNKRNYF